MGCCGLNGGILFNMSTAKNESLSRIENDEQFLDSMSSYISLRKELVFNMEFRKRRVLALNKSQTYPICYIVANFIHNKS